MECFNYVATHEEIVSMKLIPEIRRCVYLPVIILISDKEFDGFLDVFTTNVSV